MRRVAFWRAAIAALALALGACTQAETFENSLDLHQKLREHMLDKEADPVADARAAVARGDFGLISLGYGMGAVGGPPAAVLCHTPSGMAPEELANFGMGDSFDPGSPAFTSIQAYAGMYNMTMVEHPDYRDADLCAASTRASWQRYETQLDRPLRTPARPPITLHEAARRGTEQQLQTFIAAGRIDTLDGLGMTALAWAVARYNEPAIRILLEARASPWAAKDGRSAVYWAARLKRRALFARLQARPGRPFKHWPSQMLKGAIAGGDPAIVAQIVSQPHEPLQSFPRELPSEAAVEPVLRARSPGVADRLLFDALREDRLDLVRLALAYGADPNANATGNNETALGLAVSPSKRFSPEVVDLLIAAGADVDMPSQQIRPVWRVVGTLRRDNSRYGHDLQARLIFDKLVAAGADLNLPDHLGRPPIWALLSTSASPNELNSITPELLTLLVRKGLDPNADWNGKGVLAMVEEQAGKESELARTLRRLGARAG